MTLVLDTSILINLERGSEATIRQLRKLAEAYPLPARITFISEFEFLMGIQEREPKNKDKALAFLRHFSILQTRNGTADLLAGLKFRYDKKGIAISLADFIIAALTIQNNMTLVTKDKDFQKIEELKKIILE